MRTHRTGTESAPARRSGNRILPGYVHPGLHYLGYFAGTGMAHPHHARRGYGRRLEGQYSSASRTMILPICETGEPVLRRPARELTAGEIHSAPIQELIAHMFETMYNAPGVGL